MTVNDQQNALPRVRMPVCKAIVNGTIEIPVVDIEIEQNNFLAPDCFRLTSPLSLLPPQADANFWSSISDAEINIQLGFQNTDKSYDLKNRIYAQIDQVRIDLVKRTLSLSGRDLSARLLDTRLSINYSDRTSSYIIQDIAKRHYLGSAIAPTTIKVGTYYQIENMRMLHNSSEWELVSMLAQQENFDIWMDGTTLNFQPTVTTTNDPYALTWRDDGVGGYSANVIDLVLDRAQTIARDVIVKVATWNHKSGIPFVATGTAHGLNKSLGPRSGTPTTYYFTMQNLSKDQANKWAQSKAEEISKHERVIKFTVPGDNILTTRMPIRLSGTGTSFDQIYYADSITHHMSVHHGYTMDVRAKNRTTGRTITVQ